MTVPHAVALAYGIFELPGEHDVTVIDLDSGVADVSAFTVNDGVIDSLSACP